MSGFCCSTLYYPETTLFPTLCISLHKAYVAGICVIRIIRTVGQIGKGNSSTLLIISLEIVLTGLTYMYILE